MRIGIDVDGTLARTIETLVPWYNQRYGTTFAFKDIKKYELTEAFGISYEEMTAVMGLFFCTPLFQRLSPYPFSQEVTRQLRNDRHELLVITGRLDELASKTEEWIQRHFRNRFSGIVHCNHYNGNGKPERDKVELCKELGIALFIEDHPTYSQRCAEAGIPTLLFDQPWNTSVKAKNLRRVHSWREIEGIIHHVRSRRK